MSTTDVKPVMAGMGASTASVTSLAVPLTGVALGIDVGGTGVKAAMVDLATAKLVSPRIREETPRPSEPAAVLETIASVVARVRSEHGAPGSASVGEAGSTSVGSMPAGCGLPGVIKHGFMRTAANLDQGWVGYDAATAISDKLGTTVHVINDADAAGMAEMAYGAARDCPGTIILLTLGTGIGSALISDGRMVPNTEFGHLILRRKVAETLVSGAARERRGLGWKAWSREFNEYLAMLEFFLWPDRIILGGGVSKSSKKYWKHLKTDCELVKAQHLNTSGIIGAAYAAALAGHEVEASGPASRSGGASPSGG